MNARIRDMVLRMPAFPCAVNTPAPQGYRDTTNSSFNDAGVGAMARDKYHDNIGPLT
jgi:hypothetical protein